MNWDDYQGFLVDTLKEHRTPGASVGFARDGRMVHHHAYGLRDAEERLPVTPDTVYGVGSITKSFTAVAIMQLQEQGRLSVHDPVRRWLPEYRTPDAAMAEATTLHHLLTHTAGLPPLPTLRVAMRATLLADPDLEDGELRKKLEAAKAVETVEELMAFVAETPFELLGPPGEKFSYSNDSWALLGAVVARASGEPYEAYVERHILGPAGMTRSTFSVETLGGWDDVATLYTEKREGGRHVVRRSPAWWATGAMSAAGFLKSSARDMLRYAEIYRTGGVVDGTRILAEESVRAMTAPHAAANSPVMAYGYGLMITPDYHGKKLVEHGGNIKGASAYLTVVPEAGLSCVALSNVTPTPGARLTLGAVNMALELPVATPREAFGDHPCGAERLLAYTGDYVSGEGATVTVLADRAGLVLCQEGERFPARCVGEDWFAVRMRGQESRIGFLRDGAGEVSALTMGFRIIGRGKVSA